MSNSDRPVRYVVRFTGHVQGVGFRATAAHQTRGLGVDGFIRNEPDGSVRMDVEGPESSLQELLRRIEQAMGSHLDQTSVDECPPLKRRGGFQIEP